MRAVVYDRWGGPEVLRIDNLPTPVPKDDELLVRVRAASINSWDWDLMIGRPYFVRPEGFAKGPKRLGFDVAGIVEGVGKDATRFKPGDAVCGDIGWRGPGTLAEYACGAATSFAPMPATLSFERAASLPQAGMLALQALAGKTPVEVGQHVLINGAGGGVGTIGIQICKMLGAIVTGVDGADKTETMRAAGADRTIDYRQADFTAEGVRYDRILDVVANRPLGHYARALKRRGRLVVVGGTPGTLLRIGLGGPLLGLATGKRMGLLFYRPNGADLERLTSLVDAGKVRPVIDSMHPLDRVRDAMQRLYSGAVHGKVVVTIG